MLSLDLSLSYTLLPELFLKLQNACAMNIFARILFSFHARTSSCRIYPSVAAGGNTERPFGQSSAFSFLHTFPPHFVTTAQRCLASSTRRKQRDATLPRLAFCRRDNPRRNVPACRSLLCVERSSFRGKLVNTSSVSSSLRAQLGQQNKS